MKLHPHTLAAGQWKAPERDFSSVLLDLNENQFLESFLNKFLADALHPRDLYTYPNYRQLLDALSDYCQVPRQHLLLTNGADQAIDLVVRLIFAPGAQVVVPSPVFSFYYQMLDVNGVKSVVVPYERRGQSFHLPCDAVLEALPGSDGLILCNPNNPLGVQIEPDDLQRLIALCVELDKPVIVDECYYEYLRHSCLEAFSGLEQLFVIRSFSKYFGLAGLRLGYVVASTHAVRQLLKLRGPWDINHAAVKAALHCLANQSELAAAHGRQDRVRERLIECCQRLGIGVINTSTNFLLLDDTPERRLAKAFHRARIRFSDCSGYPHAGSSLNNVLRVAIPGSDDLQPFIQALHEA
ncbi:histidinol-phosphate transaminase [Pseudomonas sp. PAGU 2196]|uniref:pyridoxal phosphate-dependent aminotransferase n=1 Tax=Pseudomonas sp. PAGU 2196 TaxID=2793997 RepID=UPI001EE1258C|nr:histidinol-phosphate transaminase [Pseudomonas sp. PAGU 2196]GHS82180.1 histidinol-phosphate transaminase [Pseudomonas sp. PAGU 2196]